MEIEEGARLVALGNRQFQINYESILSQRSREDTPDVKLSKFLSYVCRHGAEKEGIQVHAGEVT